MNTISYKHHLYTEEVNNKALAAFDDKKFILENGIDSLPYGYTCVKTFKLGDFNGLPLPVFTGI